jgi:microcystin-dependent protein
MGSPYIGEIRLFGGNFAIQGWAFCDGQLMAISQNDTLFTLIGTTYGGDGQETFALPDLRGRVPIHQGIGPDGTPYVIGQSAGSETITLTTQQIPAHSHSVACGVGSGTQVSPQNGYFAATPGGNSAGFRDTSSGQMHASALSAPPGGGVPHENMMPFLTVTFIISLFGIFPSQN